MRHAGWMTVVIALGAVAGCSRVVGFECREGFSVREGRCVRDGAGSDAGDFDAGVPFDGDLPDGMPHDGRIVGDGSNGRRDGEVADGAAEDGATPDGATGDAGSGGGDAGAGDAGGDAGPVPCELGEMRCGTACIRPDTDPMHCGACGVACGATEVCSAGACAPFCTPPLTMCGSLCVDLTSDPDHCGACPIRCASGICIDSICSSGVAGHLIVVGHDYRVTRMGMNRIAGNSVFLGSGAPVEVLVYEEHAPMPVVTGTDRAIDQVATERGRSWTRIVAAADEVPAMLRTANAFVVYAQENATDAELQTLGRDWSVALDGFLRRGGVVVVFDGDATANAGTWQILTSAGLFDATGRTDVSGSLLDVVAPADATVVGVPLRYRGERSTVTFDSTESGVIVRDGTMAPIVFHQSVVP